MECTFCKNTFCNKQVLISHQKRAKYCIKIQMELDKTIKNELKVCTHCQKSFSLYSYKRHLEKCKSKKISKNTNILELKSRIQCLITKNNEYLRKLKISISEKKKLEQIKSQLNQKIQDFETNNKLLNQKIMFLEEKVKSLSDQVSSSNECIKEIALQPKTQTNIQNNKLMINTPFDINDSKLTEKIVDEKWTYNDFYDGQKGAARFVVKNLLKDVSGELLYICTDPARHIFKFIDENGDIVRDVKAQKLTELLTPYIIDKSNGMMGGLIDKYPDQFDIISSNHEEIRDMRTDNTGFRTELSALTTR